jgi:DNA polymerase III epsilon subunit-like protein
VSCFDSKLKENTEKRVVFDTETTGFDFRTDVICQLALSELLGTQLA